MTDAEVKEQVDQLPYESRETLPAFADVVDLDVDEETQRSVLERLQELEERLEDGGLPA